MRRLGGLIAFLGSSALAPPSAFAGDPDCLWRALPEQVRAGALKAYLVNGNVGDALPDAAVFDAVKKCVSPPRDTRRQAEIVNAAGLSLTAYAAQLGSQAALMQSLRLSPAELNKTWGAVPASTRKIWADEMLSGKPPSERLMVTVAEAGAAAYPKRTPSQVRHSAEFEHFMMYFGARAMRERLDPRF